MAEPKLVKYTIDEFYADESLPECCELIKGTVYDMAPAPDIKHQDISGNILCDIANYIRRNKGGCKVRHAPSDVKLGDDTIVQPDIYVTCKPENNDGQKLCCAPDWVIEIVSRSSVMHDYVTKLELYHKAGVREYWIADPRKSVVCVYVWDGEENDMNIYSFDDSIPVHIYKNAPEELAIKISEYLE